MSRRTPSPVFLNCGVVPPLRDSACPTLRALRHPRSAPRLLASKHSPDLSMTPTGPESSRRFIFARSQQSAGAMAARRGLRGEPEGEAAELGPRDIERQESPLDRVPDQLGLIAQAKLSHQVCPMALDRPHTNG